MRKIYVWVMLIAMVLVMPIGARYGYLNSPPKLGPELTPSQVYYKFNKRITVPTWSEIREVEGLGYKGFGVAYPLYRGIGRELLGMAVGWGFTEAKIIDDSTIIRFNPADDSELLYVYFFNNPPRVVLLYLRAKNDWQ